MTAVLAGIGLLGGATAVGVSLLVITIVLIAALRFGHRISRWIHSPEQETFLLKLIGAALLVAGLASAMQVSAAVGAFLLGIAISGATADSATRLLEPLRDLFAATFFVAFGLNTDPSSMPPVLGWAVLLGIVTAATKMATGAWTAWQAGIGRWGRVRAGTVLIARGEFSIVIAGLAVASGVLPQELNALVAAYVVLMAVAGPVAARFTEPLLRRMLRQPEFAA
jgi:CPA2 family monovalent cation:H+ antiporter-2